MDRKGSPLMEWNKDMDAAPRGEWVERKGPKDSTVKVHVPVRIIALMSTGEWTPSYWVEKSQRWCMFTKDSPPVAWMVPTSDI